MAQIISIHSFRGGTGKLNTTANIAALLTANGKRVDTIDMHPDLNEKTLLSLVISHALLIIMWPDQQDYEGTGVTVAVARKLNVPHMMLVVNKVPAAFDPTTIKAQVEAAYDCPVTAVLPHSDEMMTLASSGIFALEYPDHPLTALYKEVAAQLVQ